MNNKQWYVLGIGLVLMSFVFGWASAINDCDLTQNAYMDMVEEATNSNSSDELINGLISTSDRWTISCHDKNIDTSAISTISFTLGVIFIIFSFLEPKKK